MKLLIFFTAPLLAGLVYSAPASEVATTNDDILTITDEFFPDVLAVYTAEHDIVKILTPLNGLNLYEDQDDDDDSKGDSNSIIFFVLADVNEKGERVDQGLYSLKNESATKLLDNGRDAAAANDDSKTAYFAAKDGIYIYNAEKNTADKYGTVTDDLIGIAKANGSDVLYVLTADNVVHKVTEEGTKKEVVDKVVNAKEIVLDYENNLYFYTNENIVYVLVGDEVRKIEGLPANPGSVKIINPPFFIDDGVPVIVDNKSYIAYESGTSEILEIEFVVKPSAYSMEFTIVQFYAYNKTVYEYNILTLISAELFSDIESFSDNKTNSTQSIATRVKSDLRANMYTVQRV